MAKLGQWILDNWKWLFSGAGLVLLAWIGRLFFRRKSGDPSQKIRSGKDSLNVQVGQDMHIGSEVTRNDAEEE